MNQETANYIMQRMSKYLDNSQMIKLKDTLDESLKTTITIRETYADEELEKLRDDCRELRNLAIIDVN
ncbi:MAG: hypothetical protein J5943_04615 [Oribacterium sp.]|nr:hypothetical protein [Oribacterium sp.]MBO6308135.1 hypothetical protein [Oribacterium sp.]MBP3806202.1 hypothetical protein [Oribacterium sp.]